MPDIGLRFGFGAGIGRRSEFVGLVDGSGLGLLLRLLSFGLLVVSAAGIEIVYTLDDPVKLLFQTRVGADIQLAGQKTVERIIEILLGVVGLALVIVGQTSLKFLFRIVDQQGYRIWNGGNRGGWFRSGGLFG